RRVGPAVGILRTEAFVVVIVGDQHDVGAAVVQGAPDPVGARVVAMGARTEPWVMPEGEGTCGGVRGQIRSQPRGLGAVPRATTEDLGAVRVQRDDVPGTDVEAVVPLVGTARGGPEVGVVAGSVALHVLVVARRRVADGLEAPPYRVERAAERLDGCAFVLDVAEQQ